MESVTYQHKDKYQQIIKDSKKHRVETNSIKKKINMILGKKKVRNRSDYMRIYGVGLGHGVSRSQNPRRKRNLKLDPISRSKVGNIGARKLSTIAIREGSYRY